MTRFRLTLALVLLLPAAAVACLWDYDTLAQERSRFPSALELITGKYLRHSPEFYEWRVKDRRKKLESDPGNLALHDDLVVALDRLGKYDEALAAVDVANRLQPNRYETESNWGTVLLHAGKLEDGLAHIDAAVRINPDAHFGREVYQQKLVRWILDARKDGRALPVTKVYMNNKDEGAESASPSGTDWLKPPGYDRAARSTLRAPALKGVLGMMRSGQHDNPLLLEALGRLLSTGDDDTPDEDAKQLAARAYLRAADVVADQAAKRAYRGLARGVLQMQTVERDPPGQLSLERVEADFRRELADADTWFAELRAKEIGWVNDASADPDAEFAKLYAADPEVVGDGTVAVSEFRVWWRRDGILIALFVVCMSILLLSLLMFALVTFHLVRRLRRRAKISAPTPQL